MSVELAWRLWWWFYRKFEYGSQEKNSIGAEERDTGLDLQSSHISVPYKSVKTQKSIKIEEIAEVQITLA